VSKRIVVNAGPIETRVAVQEGNLLTDLYLERHRHRSIVGSVYKGTVTNVLPGMQAAFVDIDLAKDAFLYAGDYTASRGVEAAPVALPADEAEDVADAEVDEAEPPRREAVAPIEQMLSRGQEVLVQVSKESLGTKGARVTSFISLPGRYLVYMPQSQHVGVSRRIRDDRERWTCHRAASSSARTPRARGRPSSPPTSSSSRGSGRRSRRATRRPRRPRCSTRRPISRFAWCATSSRPRWTSSSSTVPRSTPSAWSTCGRWCPPSPTA
jgi:hypothetical protein